MVWKIAFFFILPVIPAVALIGWGKGANPAKETSIAPAAKNNVVAAKNMGKAADALPGLNELDAADRQLAEQQKFCLVGGGLLGSMGKPYKMTVKGRVIFLCCKQCEETVNEDPDRVLRKLDGLIR